MDLERAESQNWLERWRKKEGLSPDAVDKIISWPKGLTKKYESQGLLRVPCCYLYELVRLYRVPDFEFHETIWSECAKWRSFHLKH